MLFRSGGAQANPYTTDSLGRFKFFAPLGKFYDVQISGTGITTYKLEYVALGIADQIDAKTVDYTMTKSDFFKVITMNATTAKTIFLLSVDISDVNAIVTIVKLGVGALIIDAADSDTIADSTAGAGIKNTTAEQYATITLRLASATQWMIIGAHGTWQTY